MPENTLLLLDGNSLINRAYFGLLGRQTLTAPDGTPTGALFAFLNMYLKYIDDLAPTHVVAAFDRKEPTFRHGWYDGYKAARKPMPDELAVQIPLLKDLLKDLGVTCLEMAGYEADDLLGTLADFGQKSGMDVLIISGDKDSFQLADHNVTILQPVSRNGKTETERCDPDAIIKRYQVRPNQFVDVKAIMGDPSDNIPGVKGIGEKGATELISRYGSLDGVYDALDEIRPTLAAKLRENREMAYLSYQLSMIRRDVPVDVRVDDLILKPYSPDLADFLTRLGFQKILSRLDLSVQKPDGPSMDIRHEILSGGLSQIKAALEKKPPLIAIWQDDGKMLWWSTKPLEVNYVPAEERGSVWDFLVDQPVTVACQDYKQVLKTSGFPPLQGPVHDITIAAYLLNQFEGRPDISRIYQQATGQSLPESLTAGQKEGSQVKLPVQTDLFAQPTPEMVEPEATPDNEKAALADVVREIAIHQQACITERGIQKLVYDVEMPLAGILAAMEKLGFLVDEAVLDQLAQDMDSNLEDLQHRIFSLCGCQFNLNSPKQLGEVIFGGLGLKTGKKRSGGAYSTDSEELERLSDEHPVIPMIIEHRQVAKLRSTYIEGLRKVIDPSDGRVHTTFNQTLTATGRLSSSDPNLQNIPIRMAAGQKIRRAFIAPPGHVLLDADYSQIELRLLAHLSDDPAMIEAFVKNEDIHTNTACRIFNLAADQITPDMRGIAKTMNFSIVYGISDFGLARDLGIPVREAHRYIAEYEQQYPGVRHYLNEQIEKAYLNGYVETMTGRRRYINELKSPNRNLRQFGERAAMNTPVQGAAADLIKMAMVQADRGLRKAGLKAALILQVHDELIVEAPVGETESAAAILRDAMENAMQLKVPLLADVRSGNCWADCK